MMSKTPKSPTQKRQTKKPASTRPKKPALQAKTVAAVTPSLSAARQIDERIKEIGGWRGATMGQLRRLILEADPALIEERKWIKPSNPFGVPTYSRAGLVLTLEVYKSAVKVTFANGAKVPDPAGIFNASLLGTRRAIDVSEGASVDADAFKALVRAAVAVNLAKKA
jgi:hypothetical protein